MKRYALVLASIVALSCASSDSGSSAKVKLIEPDVEFVQLVGPAELNYPKGDMEVQYGMRIANRSSEKITLRRVEMSSSRGTGGPYRLLGASYYFKTDIGPDQFHDVAWWARAEADGDAFAIDANAPVSVRAIAYFETPAGMLRKVLVKNFTQFGEGAVAGK